MVFPSKHLRETKSFILNLIKEGDLVEANRLLELDYSQLEIRSKTQTEIGRIIASDLSELERNSGDYRVNRKKLLTVGETSK